ncbi:unnamed protein product [Cuscuta campestris]|uniref:Phthiocerol/phthiodiolone dimycocerosyl transferase C-terminal domain-containing protein n=1 Tax=Cuscuta campestris TaxID=132261 RepID=A0A484L9Z0_9ASTE|nr:unnamed protein product [Cuscuta campestris]
MAEDAAAAAQPKSRPVAGTERSWCKAVPGGTGITVLALLLSKPVDIPLLQNALRKLQVSHPILNSQLRYKTGAGNSFSYVTPPAPRITIEPFDRNSTAEILRDLHDSSISQFHLILEHELNRNAWLDPETDADTFFASLYELDGGRRVLALRFHTSVCDRSTAASVLPELLHLLAGEGECDGEREVGFGIEDCIPKGKAKKAFWARGLDMLGYSLNSFRLSNIAFQDTHSPRSSRVARMKLGKQETGRVLDGCKTRGVKLCGVLAAAGLIAARSSKHVSESHSEKYCVVTLIDCRSLLDPQLNSNHAGFYHSAVLNTHDVRGREDIWELSKRTYTTFANAKDNGKHFTDIADMNFLMGKALENPGLTPHSSMRTSFISVFEDPIVSDHQSTASLVDQVGLEDFISCSSVHGIGPSIAVFHTIRDGELDCAFVYPSPLHSRQQMQGLVDEMKRTLVEW